MGWQLHVAESKGVKSLQCDGSAVWCSQAAQSYEAVYGLYGKCLVNGFC